MILLYPSTKQGDEILWMFLGIPPSFCIFHFSANQPSHILLDEKACDSQVFLQEHLPNATTYGADFSPVY